MTKNKLIILQQIIILSLFFVPTLVFAGSGSSDFPILFALGVEAFVSIHMSIFVLIPLSNLISKENSKKTFWTLFAIRAGILLFFDFFVTTKIAYVDFIAVFVGAFLVVPISAAIKKQNPYVGKSSNIKLSRLSNNAANINPNITTDNGVILKCSKCGTTLEVTDNFCFNCGEAFDGNNVNVTSPPKVIVNASNFDSIYNNTEDKLLEEFIKRELTKAGIENKFNLIPADVLKRKNILNIIFSFLILVYISLVFFHFPIYTYVIGLIILFMFLKFTKSYNLIKYLKKEIKSRPSEKISNIVMNVSNSFVSDNSKLLRLGSIAIAIVLPLFFFMNPRIMYEKVDYGYAVRFYTFGLTNFTTATIPETHNGEPVVSLRGNTFSNMPFLETVSLPNTIIEIRGQAFKNDIKLVSVNIPRNLEYLGGASFYNCTSITCIELPNSLTYMGGETFYNAVSLENIKLSNNLTEIRGNSFENCRSLKTIKIPDNVTRIGGHAFYGNTSLTEVVFTSNSRLYEIGSSAFRRCTRLNSITLPKGVIINERSFKESPTVIIYFN